MQQTLKLAAFFLLFLVALTAALELARSDSLGIEHAERLIAAQDPSVASRSLASEQLVSGAEVLQSIFHIKEIGAAIEVRSEAGTSHYSPDLDAEDADLSIIDLQIRYTKTIVRDDEGQVALVLFRAKEE
jgi:hypothetical protein